MRFFNKRIKGIQIEIGAQTKGLDAALKSVNSRSRSLQGELRSVERLLKFDPKNMDMLRQKQELLTKAVSNTKTKLDSLKNRTVTGK